MIYGNTIKKMASLGLAIVMTASLNAQQGRLGLTDAFVDKNINDAVAQYRTLIERVPAGVLPRSLNKTDGTLVTAKSNSWISGFYPGTLLYLYEYSRQPDLLAEAEQRLQLLEKEKNNKGTHDLGFMLYCSFGNALRLTGNTHYQDILLTGAESLASRFNPTVGCIRSWDHNGDKWEFPVIIDNMMNLEFLNWASRISGDSKYIDISETHANTTLKHHFRADNSSYHVVDYDPETGAVRNKHTHQGAHHESAWARGQAWGLYGYTMMYRDTQDKDYLKQARKIATFILGHPNLPEDGIPYWDYSVSDPEAPRDASAAAITASALLELSGMVKGKESKRYLQAAEHILTSLSSPAYKAAIGTNGGFLLMHSTGHFPGNSEIDVPLSYADYYYVEALIRYKHLLAH
ncbi:glycoside hydrolase family 88 protein [Parapedobacter sp. 10938]|uniref:glycoside hydrolase family 88 protein n=1 Tax=Parapedobacter flavus TaxID=3110225 RepID=UPI002DBF224D|nr:glycoside hydrolase family 88 protein [Parapedobacter sp. 10938]MEC3879964.1 glycoside hydrolase family 88 protein [Parapedobacter sp. 10938]